MADKSKPHFMGSKISVLKITYLLCVLIEGRVVGGTLMRQTSQPAYNGAPYGYQTMMTTGKSMRYNGMSMAPPNNMLSSQPNFSMDFGAQGLMTNMAQQGRPSSPSPLLFTIRGSHFDIHLTFSIPMRSLNCLPLLATLFLAYFYSISLVIWIRNFWESGNFFRLGPYSRNSRSINHVDWKLQC